MIETILTLLGDVPIEYTWVVACCALILFTFVVYAVFCMLTMLMDMIGGFFGDRRY